MRIQMMIGAALAAVLIAVNCPSLIATPNGGGGNAPGAMGGPGGGGGGGRGRGAAGQAPANLGGAMRDMNATLTAIKAEATDPAKTEQTIHDISVLARDVAISKLQTPPWVAKITNPDDKAKEMATFRSMMNTLTRTLLDLEDAVNAKKPDDVKAAIAKLEATEKAGHAEFHVGQD